MTETSKTSSPPISEASLNATFSQALAAGATHCGWLTGPTTDQYGQDRALASHSVSPAKAKELTTRDTFGPLFGGSSPSADLQACLASRLQAQMAGSGSPEYTLIWKQWDMFAGLQICALRASARRTSDSDCGGWPTVAATEARQGYQDRSRGKKGTQESLSTVAVNVLTGPAQSGGPVGTERQDGCPLDGWWTPKTTNVDTDKDWKGQPRDQAPTGNLADQVKRASVEIAGWSTAGANNGAHGEKRKTMERKLTEGKRPSGAHIGTDLDIQALMAGWPTVAVNVLTTPAQSGGPAGTGKPGECQPGGWATAKAADAESAGMRHSRGVADTLTAQSRMAGYPTPLDDDANNTNRQPGPYTSLSRTVLDHAVGYPTPRTPTGGAESAVRKQELGRTESGGGDPQAMAENFRMPDMTGWKLNPLFSCCWLMGYPLCWGLAGLKAMLKPKKR